MNMFGKNIRVSIFGESHGEAIGITIDGLPVGLTLNESLLKQNLSKRHTNQQISTNRNETDEFKIISGYFNNKTTGAPLTFIIENKDVRSSDYESGVIRPNHSDFTAYQKYHGYNDYRGGGHFSGRLTALFVILGSICEQILSKYNINVYSHLSQVLDVKVNTSNDSEIINKIKQFNHDDFMIDKNKEELVKKLIIDAKETGNSLPSKVETLIEGVPCGLGEPFFDSFESILSHLLFSIPAVKAVSFGDEDMIYKTLNDELDELKYINNEISYLANHQGGILGGITNGNVIKFATTFKAPASTTSSKQSVNLKTGENILVSTEGRHDPIIGIRAIPVINSICYYAILDLLLEVKKI